MVDVMQQLGAVSRGVRSEMIDGEASSVQTLEQTYASPIADVWDAVTSAERIARWFLPRRCGRVGLRLGRGGRRCGDRAAAGRCDLRLLHGRGRHGLNFSEPRDERGASPAASRLAPRSSAVR